MKRMAKKPPSINFHKMEQEHRKHQQLLSLITKFPQPAIKQGKRLLHTRDAYSTIQGSTRYAETRGTIKTNE